MKKVEIGIYNGADQVAVCSTSNCSLAIRIVQEFLDFMRYELETDSLCIKKGSMPLITVSFLSHMAIVVNGKNFSYIDGVDAVTNMLADLWG